MSGSHMLENEEGIRLQNKLQMENLGEGHIWKRYYVKNSLQIKKKYSKPKETVELFSAEPVFYLHATFYVKEHSQLESLPSF